MGGRENINKPNKGSIFKYGMRKLVNFKIGFSLCDTCKKRFKCKSYLNQHVHHVHTSERGFQCDACKKRFKSKWNLNLHVHRVHTSGTQVVYDAAIAEEDNDIVMVSHEELRPIHNDEEDDFLLHLVTLELPDFYYGEVLGLLSLQITPLNTSP